VLEVLGKEENDRNHFSRLFVRRSYSGTKHVEEARAQQLRWEKRYRTGRHGQHQQVLIP
jgi:hypothetical protein